MKMKYVGFTPFLIHLINKQMNELKDIFIDWAPALIASAAILQLVYLLSDILRQKKAEKNLEKLLKEHESEFHKMLSSYKKEHSKLYFKGDSKNDFDELMMLAFVKNHINQLRTSEKSMMNKVIERKNKENQIRYVYKLISDIGFDRFFKGEKNAHVSA